MNLHHSITSIFGHSRRVAGLAFALLLFGLALFTLRLPTQAEAAAYMNHINGINNPAGHATLLAPDEISCATGTSVMVGTHEVVFAGVRYDFPTVGESTWYYCVTSGNAPAISHLTINLNLTSEGGCQDVAGGVNGAGTWGPTEDDLNPNSGAPTIGNDATTDIIGLKFDQGFSGSETRNYYFTIDGNYAIEELTLATKAGTGIDEAPVPAPSAECDTRTAKLGDYVWQDTNEDGVQDADESGVADVLVNLYDSSNTVVYTTTTDLNGFYSFPVEPGDYTVEFVPPTGYTFTLADQGADDALDSDADANTGKTATVTLNHGDNNTTLDAGLIALASLGDKVFEDQDGDGIQDAGETGISGVTVNLWSDDNGDGTPDTQISSTSTDADGMYSFTDLDPRKDYVVEFELPSADYEFMAQDQGSDDALDSDADPTTGQTAVIDLAQGENNSTIDAGMWLKRASLGDKVFEDLNANGVQDVDEPGMPSITVKLWADTNNDGTPDMLIGDAITDANGMYSFTELNPSYTYYVEFIAPENRKWTTQDSGSDDTIDSDVNPSTGFTGPITLAPGENNSDTDAGLEPKRASLAGEVFEDLDGDGIQDAGEPPMPNVTVNLWTDDNGDGTPDTQIGTTTTDADGNYSFTELDPTLTYIVEFEPVTDREWTSQDVGSDDSIDSDVNPSSNYTAPIDLEPGEDNTTTDAGLLLERASLSGKVFEDLNENGLQDSGEPIVSGTTVKLWTDVNGDGWPDFEIGSTITDANGMYSFTDLDPNLMCNLSTPRSANGRHKMWAATTRLIVISIP